MMPRPGDAVKALLMPLTFGLGVLATSGIDGRGLLRALLVLLALEFLIYPARYQWNDVRGFAADQNHPGAKDRGRLPGPRTLARQRVAASTAVAGLRLTLAAVVAVLPGLGLGAPVLAAFAAVFGVAFAYETVRAMATGRDHGVPPVRPGLVLLWITVGAGYAVRGTIGLAMAVDLRDRPALGIAAAATLWAYGITFVTSRWAVESLAFARLDGTRVTWAADASLAREHLLGLTRWLPSSIGAGGSLERWAVLRTRTPLSAPWNVALGVTGGGAAVTGVLLTRPDARSVLWLFAAAGAVLSLVVAAVAPWRPVTTAVGAAALLAALTVAAVPRPLVSVLPWVAVMAAYLHFSGQSPAAMGELGRMARRWWGPVLAFAGRVAVGHHTWQLLRAERRTDG
jgi:hypothetical protein